MKRNESARVSVSRTADSRCRVRLPKPAFLPRREGLAPIGGVMYCPPVSGGLRFEWDPAKAAKNAQKHGVSFEEATTIFGDELAITIEDPVEPDDRFIIIGWSNRQRTLVVVHLNDGEAIRIISARKATASERKTYEEGQ